MRLFENIENRRKEKHLHNLAHIAFLLSRTFVYLIEDRDKPGVYWVVYRDAPSVCMTMKDITDQFENSLNMVCDEYGAPWIGYFQSHFSQSFPEIGNQELVDAMKAKPVLVQKKIQEMYRISSFGDPWQKKAICRTDAIKGTCKICKPR